jgi:hypothetical protein
MPEDSKEPVYIKDLFEDGFFEQWVHYLTSENTAKNEYKKYLEELQQDTEKKFVYARILTCAIQADNDKLLFKNYIESIYQNTSLNSLLICQFEINEKLNVLDWDKFEKIGVNKPFFQNLILEKIALIEKLQIDLISKTFVKINKQNFSNRKAYFAYLRYKIISYILEITDKFFDGMDSYLCKNIPFLLESFYIHDLPYLNGVKSYGEKSIIDARTDFLHKNIILKNINKQHGGSGESRKFNDEAVWHAYQRYKSLLTLFKKAQKKFKSGETLYDIAHFIYEENEYFFDSCVNLHDDNESPGEQIEFILEDSPANIANDYIRHSDRKLRSKYNNRLSLNNAFTRVKKTEASEETENISKYSKALSLIQEINNLLLPIISNEDGFNVEKRNKQIKKLLEQLDRSISKYN